MKRRQFALLAFSATASPWVSGQEQFQEGKHFVALTQTQPTLDPKQREVLEFFAYGCSHCNAFEPTIDAWQKRLPKGVVFRRMPVAFRESMVVHQRLYFSLEVMGLVEQHHRKIFHAMHVERRRLDTAADIADFMAAQGVEKERFMKTFDSFSVATKAKQASALAGGYKIDGTPSIGVDGRWLTSGSLAGSNERSLLVAEHLLRVASKQ